MLQCVAVYCSVLQCIAVYCSVLQCIAVCCSMLTCRRMHTTRRTNEKYSRGKKSQNHMYMSPSSPCDVEQVQDFLGNTISGAPISQLSSAPSISAAGDALSSLISLALARGCLKINLALARLLLSSPHILKAHHLQRLRQLVTISQTWEFDTPPSCPSRARIFRPRAGTGDEIIQAWELQVFFLFSFFSFHDENISVYRFACRKWMGVLCL